MQNKTKVVQKEFPRVTGPHERPKGGKVYEYYVVDCRGHGYNGGKLEFKVRSEAIEHAQDVREKVKDFGAANVPREDFRLLERIRTKLLPFGVSIEDAIDGYLQYQASTVARQNTELVSTVTARYLIEKQRPIHLLRPDTLRGIKATCSVINSCFPNMTIGTVTKEKVKQTLEDNYDTNATRKDYLNRMKTFFKWAKGEKYITENPCDDIKFKAVKGDTEILDKDSILTLLGNLLDEKPSPSSKVHGYLRRN